MQNDILESRRQSIFSKHFHQTAEFVTIYAVREQVETYDRHDTANTPNCDRRRGSFVVIIEFHWEVSRNPLPMSAFNLEAVQL